MIFWTEIHGPKRINPIDLGDPLNSFSDAISESNFVLTMLNISFHTFKYCVPSSGQNTGLLCV